MALVFLLLLLFSTSFAIDEPCQNPEQQPGRCVIITQCPHLFSVILKNKTGEELNSYVKKSNCGLAAMFFPKVCCPMPVVELMEESGALSNSRYYSQCGLHTPDGPSDPWLALLEYENARGEKAFLCGGVLINKRYVLTQAHCVKGPTIKNFTLVNVHLGEYKGDGGLELVVPVDAITSHSDYHPEHVNQYNDIALIRLKQKLNFKEGKIRPLCLTYDGEKAQQGKTLQLAGWGKVGNTFKKRDGVTTVRNHAECSLVYNETQQICVGGKKLAYRDDRHIHMGAVLMHVSRDNTYSLLGLRSIRPPVDKEDYPKIYTHVPLYFQWIMNHLKP